MCLCVWRAKREVHQRAKYIKIWPNFHAEVITCTSKTRIRAHANAQKPGNLFIYWMRIDNFFGNSSPHCLIENFEIYRNILIVVGARLIFRDSPAFVLLFHFFLREKNSLFLSVCVKNRKKDPFSSITTANVVPPHQLQQNYAAFLPPSFSLFSARFFLLLQTTVITKKRKSVSRENAGKILTLGPRRGSNSLAVTGADRESNVNGCFFLRLMQGRVHLLHGKTRTFLFQRGGRLCFVVVCLFFSLFLQRGRAIF